jgi:hypothetical protein
VAGVTHPLLKAVGGVLGIVEAVVPPTLFVLIFALTSPRGGFPILAVAVSAASAIGFIVVRLLRREGATQAVAGLITIGGSLVLALVTGRAENNFIGGIVTNAAYAFAFLVSVLIGWPLIGVAVGLITKQGHGWRSNPREKRVLSLLTLLWVGMFALRLAVEVPLYLTQNVAGLGIAKLVLGLPLYAPVVVVTWLFVRGMFAEEKTKSDQKNVS